MLVPMSMRACPEAHQNQDTRLLSKNLKRFWEETLKSGGELDWVGLSRTGLAQGGVGRVEAMRPSHATRNLQ